MKRGLVKVQQSVDRKKAQVIAGHTLQPPRAAYRAVNYRIRTVVGQYDQQTLWNICVASPTTLRLNCLLFQ